MIRFLLVILLGSMLISPSGPLPASHLGAFRGTDFPITVQLRDLSANPVDNATILFFHEDQNILLGATQTNSTGHATFVWQIPLTHILGLAQLNATFRGDPERFLLPSMVPIQITIFAQMQAIISVQDEEGQPVSSRVNIGQELFFHVAIHDDQMSPMNNVTVQLWREPNQFITQKVTPANGSTILDCQINSSFSSPVLFTIRSLNQGLYNGTENRIQFSINNSTAYFIGIPTFWHRSYGYEIHGRLCQNTGEGIFPASFDILQESLISIGSVQTQTDGTFHLNLQNLLNQLLGNRYIVLRFNGSTGYSFAEAIIGIIPSTAINPFSQFINLTPPNGPSPLLHQISIIALGCLTITTTFLTYRMNRTTRRIVAH
ncbi:MAG: hypothetical protein Q6361_00890 [Candidatus Hermodarchaeota archaeon]|nr:hypothetical protein [Candidatus Hermodarchaeota archaeon]